MTGYVYRGRKPEGLPDLEQVNAAIMRARPAGAHDARSGAGQLARTAPEGCCRNGHEYTPATTRISTDGTRKCRTCLQHNRARRKELTS